MGRSRDFSRSLKQGQRLAYEISIHVASNAIVDGGNEASLTVNGTGDYTITLNQAAARNLHAKSHCLATAASALSVAAVDADSIQVLTTDLAGVAQDADFYITLMAYDAADEV